LNLKNASDHEITITHFSFNSPAVFTPIDPIVLKAGATKTFPLLVDSRSLFLPSSVTVYFRIRSADKDDVRLARLVLTSKESFVMVPRFVFWRVGDPATAKIVRIAQMPPGMKIIGVKAASNEFTATLDSEGNVAIKPVDTTKARQTVVMLQCDPTSMNQVSIPVIVLPALTNIPPSSASKPATP
jgi:hypothetical protein